MPPTGGRETVAARHQALTASHLKAAQDSPATPPACWRPVPAAYCWRCASFYHPSSDPASLRGPASCLAGKAGSSTRCLSAANPPPPSCYRWPALLLSLMPPAATALRQPAAGTAQLSSN